MSGAGQGFFYSPEDQASLQANQRRQAYAQALMEQGQNPGAAQYGGLRSAGNSILGAFLAKRADDKQTELSKSAQDKYVQSMAALLKGQPAAPQAPAGPQQMDPEGNVMAPGQGTPGYQAQPQQAPQGQPGGDFMSRLLATGNAGLIQQFAPDVIKNRLESENKHLTPLSPQDTAARGLRGVWGLDAAGNAVPIQQSDVKSKEAEDQAVRVSQAEKLLTPEAFKQQLELDKAKQHNSPYGPDSVFSTIDTGQGVYALNRAGGVRPLTGPDGKPLVTYHSDTGLGYDMSAARAGGKAGGATAEALPTTEAMFGEMQKNIAALKSPEMRQQSGWNTGLAGMTGVGRLPGVGSEFANIRDQLTSQTFLQGFNALRGAGAITEKEGEAATNAFTRLKKAQTNGEFYRALDDADATLTNINNAIKQRAHRGAVTPRMGGGGQGQPRVRRYNPATGQIE